LNSSNTAKNELLSYVRSGKAGIYVISYEEVRVELELKNIADQLGWKINTWSCTDGVVNVSNNPPTRMADTEDPLAMLGVFEKLPQKSMVIARDLHVFLKGEQQDPRLVRKIKDVLSSAQSENKVLIIVGCLLHVVPEIEKEMAVLEFKLPDREQLKIVAEGICKSAGLVEPDNGKMEKIIDAASGLTTTEASDAFALSVVEAKVIDAEIVARVKASTVKKNGVLEIFTTNIKASEIGGLAILKDWLNKRRLAFSKKAKEFGLPVPKGVLAVGIPGSGKSLSAKATASILEVPLLKLDAGRIFGSLVGESEKNMRLAIQTAEAVAPCVLWVDEIEKGFSGSKSSGSTDGGTSARVFGTFLQWMQDKTAPVFVFATANDISQLPPEFLRKGRFDELFFVDLPTADERAEIWSVHLSKRGRKADEFDIAELSGHTDGFTGAEIEAAVSEALFAAFDEDAALEDRHLSEAVKNTVPLSKTMAANIEALRGWAQGRARRASADTSIKSAAQKGVRKLA
jgi:ATP-dependent 26S proteasome regulatory subunit